MTMRTLTRCWLAATLALASCKSDDKPRPPEKTNVESPPSPQDKAAETARAAKDQAGTAADQAKAAIDAVRDKARAAGEVAKDRAADAINDATTLRNLISVLDDRIARAIAEVENAPSDDARKAAAAALEKLKQEKQQIVERLDELKDARAP